jgi:hypothetical protein
VTGLVLDDWRTEVRFRSFEKIIFSSQPSVKWVPGAFSLGVNQPGREAYRLPPSNILVKNAWGLTYTPP